MAYPFFLAFRKQSQVMQASITLDAGPLLRALYVLLITCTALLAMPSRAGAQIYVSQVEAGIVSEYDTKTGQVINANFITALPGPGALRLSGDVLFVANQFGAVAKYDAKSGRPINPSFITGTNFSPTGLALSGGKLFVANGEEGTVGKYDGNTGKAINVSFITGLTPRLIGLGSLGDSLFVADSENGTVGKYNARTGKEIRTLDVESPYGIAFFGEKLFVASANAGIAEYNAKTLELINANFITDLNTPYQIAVLDGNFPRLFVTNITTETVGEYDAKTGEVINAAFISAGAEIVGIAVRP